MFSIITACRSPKNLVVWGWLLAACAATATCDKLPLLAPNGSTITLSTSSNVVQTNGTAEIRATVLESSGTPVQNGTTVTFSTNLGAMSPTDARTTNGVAIAQFVANGQSGTATIHANSGSAAPPSTQTTGLTLTVGGAAAAKILVSASPNRLSVSGGSSVITATVSDTNGNPLNGITVSFSTDAGSLSSGTATTNTSGQATTTLTTNRDATVTAAANGGSATPGTVKVTVGTLPTLAFGAYTPANPTTGQIVTIPLTITTTAGNDSFQSVTVNFGDGTSRALGPLNSNTSVAHAFSNDGVFTVTATGIGVNGDQTQTSTQVAVSPKTPVGISLSFTPAAPTAGTLVTFTVSFDTTAPSNVSGYDWVFGDGATDHTTGKSTSHTYTAAGTYTARVTVSTVDGNSGNATTQVKVN